MLHQNAGSIIAHNFRYNSIDMNTYISKMIQTSLLIMKKRTTIVIVMPLPERMGYLQNPTRSEY
jgi:hypothetical protein